MTTHPTLDAIRGILAEHPYLETWAGHFEMRVPELAAVKQLGFRSYAHGFLAPRFRSSKT